MQNNSQQKNNENDVVLTTSNKKIINFYKKTKLDFEETNLTFIDFFEKTNILSTSFENKTDNILEKLKHIENKLFDETKLKNEMSLLHNSIKQLLDEQTKTSFNEIKTTIVENKNTIIKEINDHTQKQNDNNIDKITDKIKNHIVNEFTPRNNNELLTQLNNNNQLFERKLENEILKMTNSTNLLQLETAEKQKTEFQSFIHNEMNKLLATNISKDAFDIYVSNVEKKMETICNHISSLNKINNNSYLRGLQSENTLEELLLKTFKNVEIIKISHIDHCCDIIYDDNEDVILIENKCYTKNVPSAEVAKFQKDCLTNNRSGIMMQQEEGYGICGKDDFEFEITQNNNVLLYVHNCNYSSDKIKTAVNIIKFFKKQLKTVSSNQNHENIVVSLNINDYQKLKKDYENIVQKNNNNIISMKKSIKIIKDELDVMNAVLKTNEENKFIEINHFFQCETTNVFVKNEKQQCEFCGKMFSSQGFGPHRKSCKKNMEKNIAVK